MSAGHVKGAVTLVGSLASFSFPPWSKTKTKTKTKSKSKTKTKCKHLETQLVEEDMVQGFKNKKACSSLSKTRKAQPVKKGGRVVPPNKPAAVTQKLRKEKVSKSVNADIERLVVSKSVGKLTIMKPIKEAENSKVQEEKTLQKNKSNGAKK